MAQNLTSFSKKNLPNYCLKIEQEQQKCNSIDDNLYLKKKKLLVKTEQPFISWMNERKRQMKTAA